MSGRGRIAFVQVAVGAGVWALVASGVATAQPPSGIVHAHRKAGMSKVEFGRELFAGNCSSCHGSKGQGISPARPDTGSGGIAGEGPDLRGVGALAPDFYLRTGRMPLSNPRETPQRNAPFFNRAEIRAMVRYVASLGKGPPVPHPHPATRAVSQGLHLFTDHCAGCHQVVGEGGYLTDTKVPVLQHASPRDIAEAVRIGPYFMPSFSKQDISDRKLNAIIAYVQRSQHPNDAGGVGIGHIGPVPEGMVAWAVAGFVLIGVCAAIGKRLKRS